MSEHGLYEYGGYGGLGGAVCCARLIVKAFMTME